MKTRFPICALIGSLALAGSASAFTPFEVFSEADAAAGNAGATFLDTVAVFDGTAYAFLRDTSTSTDVGYITAFDGVSFTTIMDETDWATTGSTFDMAAGFGAGIVGGNARFVSFFDNSVYEVDLGTGAVSEVVPTSSFSTALGVTANLPAQFKVGSDGTIYGFNTQTDSIYSVSPTNQVTIEVPTDALGATSVGGIGIDGNIILIGDNTNDSLIAWDTITNSKFTVLTEAQIDAVTLSDGEANDGTVGFGDIFAAPDGLVYFYETDGNDLLSYDPSDPAGTLQIVVSEAEFLLGDSSETINQLAWWNGNIAFTDTSEGFYSVPEPSSLALLALGGLAMARRRRASH